MVGDIADWKELGALTPPVEGSGSNIEPSAEPTCGILILSRLAMSSSLFGSSLSAVLLGTTWRNAASLFSGMALGPY